MYHCCCENNPRYYYKNLQRPRKLKTSPSWRNLPMFDDMYKYLFHQSPLCGGLSLFLLSRSRNPFPNLLRPAIFFHSLKIAIPSEPLKCNPVYNVIFDPPNLTDSFVSHMWTRSLCLPLSFNSQFTQQKYSTKKNVFQYFHNHILSILC